MAKHGKKYREVLKKVDRSKTYSLDEAVKLVKETSYAKFDATVDVAVNLGVDPRHADQNVRGAVVLPHGLGKPVRVVVFSKGEKAVEAQNEGADYVGADDLVKKIQDGWLEFDQVVATPDMMGQVGRLGKILGPRGLMPNPKLGTVTFEVGKAVRELKAGRAEFRVDKGGIAHTVAGKVSFDENKLKDNVKAIIEAIVRAKPASAKGVYLKKISLSATMGPGIVVDTMPFRQ